MIIGVAIKTSDYNTYGKTNDYILKKQKWITTEERYQLTIQKMTHKLLNTDSNNRHFLAEIMTNNHTIRMSKENKLGPKSKIAANDKYTTKTFTLKNIDIYNRLDRKFTLLINTIKFKKCLNILYTNPQTTFKMKTQPDYDPKVIMDYKSDIFLPCSNPITP